MCRRCDSFFDKQQVAQDFHVRHRENVGPIAPDYNIAPTPSSQSSAKP
jgi:hypothetical protein